MVVLEIWEFCDKMKSMETEVLILTKRRLDLKSEMRYCRGHSAAAKLNEEVIKKELHHVKCMFAASRVQCDILRWERAKVLSQTQQSVIKMIDAFKVVLNSLVLVCAHICFECKGNWRIRFKQFRQTLIYRRIGQWPMCEGLGSRTILMETKMLRNVLPSQNIDWKRPWKQILLQRFIPMFPLVKVRVQVVVQMFPCTKQKMFCFALRCLSTVILGDREIS